MNYTGRIIITMVVLAIMATVRIYGNLYLNYSLLNIPYLGIVAILICWWLGRQYDKVKFYSEKDALTELHNRRFVIQIIPKLLSKMDKRNHRLTLFLIDVDNFKIINDTYGHEMGDKVLQSISRTLLSITTKKDIVARWAGDEFLIITPFSDDKMSKAFLEKIKNGLKNVSGEIKVDVSVSIGTANYPDEAKTLNALLHSADHEMYAMKSRTKSITATE